MPQVIAQDIVGVQPMGESEWRTGEGNGLIDDLEYWIQAPTSPGMIFSYASKNSRAMSAIEDMETWCKETFGKYAPNWYRDGITFYFLKEEDRTAFALRWIG